MSLNTLPRHLRLDPDYVNQEFAHIAKHALDEPTELLPFIPRSNSDLVPHPRQPADDLPPTPTQPPDTDTEIRRPGRHRAPRPTITDWLGSRAARTTAMTMLAAGIALQGTSTLLESSMEQKTAYNVTLREPAIVFPDVAQPIDNPVPTTKPAIKSTTAPPKSVATHNPAPPKVTAPAQKPKVITPAKTPAHPTATTKKPATPAAEAWPAPGTNCDYLPKHQHKANITSAAQAKAIFKKMVIACFGTKEWPAAEQLWKHESNFRPMARNPHGGACGVVQSLPCSKLLKASGARTLGDTTVEKQARWGIRYVKRSYGTPSRAWRHWQASVNINGREVGHWY